MIFKEQIHLLHHLGTTAPEMLDDDESREYSWEVDIWSLGVLLFRMMENGKFPF